MGATPHINADAFPKQGAYIGKRVKVCYNYDTSRTVEGVVIRDDTTEPGLMIIHTDDGRALLSTECMWSPIKS
tara:strand:+ start:3760 stop:3978 length:219 start_codon:yes stop_codon:yes gene_type:complete